MRGKGVYYWKLCNTAGNVYAQIWSNGRYIASIGTADQAIAILVLAGKLPDQTKEKIKIQTKKQEVKTAEID